MSAAGAVSIHVLVPFAAPGAAARVEALIEELTESAAAGLRSVGADVTVIDVSANQRPTVADACAAGGIVLLGGGDLDPRLYGGDPDHPALYGVDRRADDYSIAAVTYARDAGVPVLGVCRGTQVINVAAGGTLYAHLEPGKHYGPTTETLFVDETVGLEPDSWLWETFGRDRLAVRSGHHQAIRDVGAEFRVTAYAADGGVEAIEARNGWCVGVQWHPEESGADADDAGTLFGAFVGVCDTATG